MNDVQKPSPSSATSVSDAAQTARNQVSGLIDQASDQFKGLTDQASSMAQNATSDLKDAARGFVSDTTDKLRNVVEDQKSAGADRGHQIADAVRRAAGALEQELPQAADYIKVAADQIDNVAEAIRRRDVSELLGQVQNIARTQPTAFLAATALAGFALVRLLKTSAASEGSGQSGGSQQYRPQNGGQGSARSPYSSGGTSSSSVQTPYSSNQTPHSSQAPYSSGGASSSSGGTSFSSGQTSAGSNQGSSRSASQRSQSDFE